MRITKCPLCKGKNFVTLYTVSTYTIVQCVQCDFIFVTNVPSQQVLDRYYAKKDYTDPKSAEVSIRSDALRSLALLEPLSGKKTLLDVGCGRGYFLDEARTRGWDCKGIDYSSEVLKYATNTLKLAVEKQDIFKYKPKEKFNVVSLNQVIEHFSDPEKLISTCKKLLKPNGVLYIATPNIDSLSAKLYKDKFDYIIPPEHLSYFSEKTLQHLFEKLGLKIEFIGTWSYPPEFAGIVKYYVRSIFGKERVENSRKHDELPKKEMHTMKSEHEVKNSSVKSLKKTLFDDMFCTTFHSLIDIVHQGSMVHVIGRNI